MNGEEGSKDCHFAYIAPLCQINGLVSSEEKKSMVKWCASHHDCLPGTIVTHGLWAVNAVWSRKA